MGILSILITLIMGLHPARSTAQQSLSETVTLDIPYIPNGGHKQQLDLYTPAQSNFPTILFVHEGSLTSGDRKDEPYARMCRTFQQLGIGCAAMSYRLAPEYKWPAQPNDVAAAFAWVKQNIGSYGGDPNRIFLFGHSSGCLLVSMVSTDSQYLATQGLTPGDIAGVIPLGCRLSDFVEVADAPPSCCYEASWVPTDRVDDYMESESAFTSLQQRQDAVPAAHVTADIPPTLVLIAEDERFFPPILRDASEFVGRALSAGAEDADLAILENRRHFTAIQMMVTPDDPAVVKVAEFVKAH